MLKPLLGLCVVLAALTSVSGDKTAPGDKAAGAGGQVPEFVATKWYNTAPLTLEDLKGKGVLLQVFRTW